MDILIAYLLMHMWIVVLVCLFIAVFLLWYFNWRGPAALADIIIVPNNLLAVPPTLGLKLLDQPVPGNGYTCQFVDKNGKITTDRPANGTNSKTVQWSAVPSGVANPVSVGIETMGLQLIGSGSTVLRASYGTLTSPPRSVVVTNA